MTNRSDETTADKAARHGMTPDEYRAHRHLAAVRQIRAALPGLYATTGLRVEAALTEPAAVSAVVEPPADQTTPSHRAGLRDRITTAISKWHRDPEQPLYEQGADAVLAVLYREWPWLRAEAEDAGMLPAPADRAAVTSLRRLADECPQDVATPPRLADETPDTLAAWLYQRFMVQGVGWDDLDEGDRTYWEHHARAVRRAVARGGFKQPDAGARQDGGRP